MYDDPTLTFSGGGFERAAQLRGSPSALRQRLTGPGGRCLAIWRGKPLLQGDRLAWLPFDHAMFDGVSADPIFLGLTADAAWFLHDVSAWQPENETRRAGDGFLDLAEQRHPDRKSTRLNSSHIQKSRMPSSA